MPKLQAADLVKQCLSQFLDVLRSSGMVTVEKQARLGKFLERRPPPSTVLFFELFHEAKAASYLRSSSYRSFAGLWNP